ncbi:MAG: hypothetical protein U0350_18935 [Caldilineaceae bacterium]
MAVMAEFLVRGYNVAVPEVDIGDDIFVVKDRDGEYSRVQVKAAIATKTSIGYSARYAIKFSQMKLPSSPETWFVFANRLEERWRSFVVISRPELNALYIQNQFGALNQNGSLSLYLSYSDATVICSGQDFSHYLNNWSAWPYVQHDG